MLIDKDIMRGLKSESDKKLYFTILSVILVLQVISPFLYKSAEAVGNAPAPPRNKLVLYKQIGKGSKSALYLTIRETWEKIESDSLQCGAERTYQVTTKTGIEKTRLTELSSKVGGEMGVKDVGKLNAAISLKTGTIINFSKEVTKLRSWKFKAPEYGETDFAIYQKVWKYEFRYLNWSTLKHLFGNPNWSLVIEEPKPEFKSPTSKVEVIPGCKGDEKKKQASIENKSTSFVARLRFDYNSTWSTETGDSLVRQERFDLYLPAYFSPNDSLILPGFSHSFSDIGDIVSYKDLPRDMQGLLSPVDKEQVVAHIEIGRDELGPTGYSKDLIINVINLQPLYVVITDTNGFAVQTDVQINDSVLQSDELGTILYNSTNKEPLPVKIKVLDGRFRSPEVSVTIPPLDDTLIKAMQNGNVISVSNPGVLNSDIDCIGAIDYNDANDFHCFLVPDTIDPNSIDWADIVQNNLSPPAGVIQMDTTTDTDCASVGLTADKCFAITFDSSNFNNPATWHFVGVFTENSNVIDIANDNFRVASFLVLPETAIGAIAVFASIFGAFIAYSMRRR